MNYTTLKTNVAAFLNRQDLTDVIPTFIELGEAAINRQLRHRKMLARATNNFQEHFLTLPDDFLQAKNIQLDLDPVVSLQYVTLEHADQLRAGPAQTPGIPRYYCIVGDQLEAVPIPAENYTVELTYYVKVPTLSDAEPTNWLIETFPDVYLYGTLVHTAPYLKDDVRVALWGSLYERAIEHANMESERSEISGNTPIAWTNVQW